MKRTKVKQKFSERLKDEFDFDVSEIGTYVDEQSEDIVEELVLGGSLVSRVQVMEGVKGSEKIKLMKMDTPLQSAESCGRTPDGDIIFTDKTISSHPVKIDMATCNKTLKGTWAQMLLALGKRAEKENLPLEDVIAAFVVKRGHLKNQDIMFRGDVDSVNPDLVHYDGYIKKWKADNLLYKATFEGPLTVENAFARFVELAYLVPEVLLDNGIVPEIICSRKEAQMVLQNIYNDKDYSANIDVNRDGGELSFVLPTTNITVRSYPQLKPAVPNTDGVGVNAGEVFIVPYEFMFFATDLEGDIDEFWLKYEDIQEKLFFGCEWGSGVEYVYADYFGKLELVAPEAPEAPEEPEGE
jgi:hypothetical protein